MYCEHHTHTHTHTHIYYEYSDDVFYHLLGARADAVGSDTALQA